MITVKPNRSVYIPERDKHIGFENDHMVETRFFEVLDPALFDFSFKLDIENTKDIVDLAPLKKTEDRLLLVWNITSAVLGSGGVITAQLRAFDANSEHIWHSAPMEFIAEPSIHALQAADTTHNLSEFEQLETRITAAVSAAQSAKDSAESASDDAAAAYQNALDEALNASASASAANEILQSVSQKAAQVDEAAAQVNEAAADLSANIVEHIQKRTNPHGVTASQVGAYTKAEANTLLNGKADAVHTHAYAGSATPGGAAETALQAENAAHAATADHAARFTSARKINGVSFNGTADITVYDPHTSREVFQMLGATGWYRIVTRESARTYGSLFLFLDREYNKKSPENYIFAIAQGHLRCAVTPLVSNVQTQFFTKLRYVFKDDSSPCYFEVYYDSTTQNKCHAAFLSGNGAFEIASFTGGGIPEGYSATTFEIPASGGSLAGVTETA